MNGSQPLAGRVSACLGLVPLVLAVRMMPQGADNIDVRYNGSQWVHRSTRGWSYGNSVTDPRTGEIIKGHVSLGSLRVRQGRAHGETV